MLWKPGDFLRSGRQEISNRELRHATERNVAGGLEGGKRGRRASDLV